jgi:hypothetical protein
MQGQEHILHEIVTIGSLEEPMSDPQHALQQGHDLATSCA